MAEPKDYLIPGRKAKINFGFGNEEIQVFCGESELPLVQRSSRTAKIHFLDELEKISNFKLSGGQLQLNIRVDRYIWGILDEIYKNYFTVIASCDTGESWTGGEHETVNHRGGNGAIKITSSGGALQRAYTVHNPALNLSSFSNDDYVDFFLYCENAELIDSLKVRFETTVDTDYFEVDLSENVVSGWNEFHLLRSGFVKTGSGDWSSIVRTNVFVDGNGTDTIFCIIDEIRMVDKANYPQRCFDIGLQDIPVAWWAGNTALYEIKTACEAEGAIFYADENGVLRFENRQHYNLNPEHKASVWEFTFDRATDFEYPKKESDIINSVVVKLKPRVVVDTAEEIWRYGFIPSIGASETKTIWASFQDPCPSDNTGILDPVATEDYTANTQADGGGADKTAQLDIVLTRFADSVKIDITNNDVGAVYLTYLRLMGTPAKESDEVFVYEEDANSIAAYRERPAGGLSIENKYLADEDYASTRAKQIIDWYKDPKTMIVLNNRCVPQLQIGDMISVVNSDLRYTYLMRVISIKNQFNSQGGLMQEICSRPVMPQELLTYFEIGVSEIEGPDVISP